MGYEIFIAFKEMTVDVRPCIRTGKSSLKSRSHSFSVTPMEERNIYVQRLATIHAQYIHTFVSLLVLTISH